MNARPVAAGLLLSLIAVAPSAAQERMVVSGPPVCDCEISLTRLGPIGGPSDTIGLSRIDAGKIRVSGEDVWVPPATLRHVVASFGYDGSVRCVVRREGEGPGEFRWIRGVEIGPDGTLHIFADARESLYSASGVFLEVRPAFARPLSLRFLGDGSYVVNGAIRTRERIGLPLHVVDSAGRLRRSFGPVNTGLEPHPSSTFALAAAGDGTVWAAPRNRYELTLWDTGGERRKVLSRSAEWFEPWEEYVSGREGTPNPTLWNILQDQEGLVWALTFLPEPDFEPLTREDIDPLGVQCAEDPDYDTVVEVIDPERGVLVASRRFDQRLTALQAGRIVVGYASTPAGHQLFTLWRLGLERS